MTADVGREQRGDLARLSDRTGVAGAVDPADVARGQHALQQLRAAAEVVG